MKCSCHSHNGFLLGPAGPAQQTSLEGLAPLGDREYVDNRVSVSAFDTDTDLYAHVTDLQLLEQSERFLNGS